MSKDDFVWGFLPTGEAFPVRAAVNRIYGRGALYGFAVGSALGAVRPDVPPSSTEFPALAVAPGALSLAPGAVTCNVQMATCLASSLMANGRLNLEDVAQRYVEWFPHALRNGLGPFLGAHTTDALQRIANALTSPSPLDTPPNEVGRRLWLESGRTAAGHGALMRTLPIGLFYSTQPDELLEATLAESALTHVDPRVQLACVAFNAAIAAGTSQQKDAREMAVAAVLALDTAAPLLLQRAPNDEQDAIRAAHLALRSDLAAAMADDPELYSGELHLLQHAGFVRVAFRLAFWHLLHTDSLHDALIDVVSRGGAADTNAALTGALLGAAHGDTAVPEPWREAVMSAPCDTVGEVYHPRTLLTFVAGPMEHLG